MNRRNAVIGAITAAAASVFGSTKTSARVGIQLGFTTYYCDRGDGVFYVPEGAPELTHENIVVGYQAWGDIDGEIRPHAFADVPPTPGDVFVAQHPKMLARVFACQIYFY